MLRLTGVSKRYGERQVLRRVTLNARPGTVLLLAGPNGAGKSTLLHIMAGLLRPDEGMVECRTRAGAIGYLGHNSLIYPDLTALENLAFWCALHGKSTDERLLLTWLSRLGLAAFADEKAAIFSRGMTQRLSLARLFLLEPELILLDEPGTGLDAASAASLRSELSAAKERGAALIWVTHNLAEDLSLADEIAVLRDGQSETKSRESFDLNAYNRELAERASAGGHASRIEGGAA